MRRIKKLVVMCFAALLTTLVLPADASARETPWHRAMIAERESTEQQETRAVKEAVRAALDWFAPEAATTETERTLTAALEEVRESTRARIAERLFAKIKAFWSDETAGGVGLPAKASGPDDDVAAEGCSKPFKVLCGLEETLRLHRGS